MTDMTELTNVLPGSLTLTENLSYTYATTESKCLNFYFDVLQNTDEVDIESHLDEAWSEDALLTLKLIFQLRDIRNGKGAKIEFHHCLLWLYHNHRQTLMENLQHVAGHGYWKDLGWIIKFILTENVSMTTDRQKRVRFFNTDELQTNDLDEIINKRLKGQLPKIVWQKYLKDLPSDDAKLEARKRYLTLSKTFQLEQSRKAKEAKKASQAEAAAKVEALMKNDPKFAALYEKVVRVFADALKEDKQTLTNTNRLPSTAFCGKWSPTIGCSIDFHTLLGKNIAKVLYPAENHRKDGETDRDFYSRINIAYRKEYLIPLRKAIHVAESLMSRNKWNELDYSRVPSVCMKRNKKNFEKHDKERFTTFLGEVESGKKKIASGALLPHEIVAQLMMARDSKMSEQVSELQWKSYVENLKKSGILESALAIADVSGSMSGTPMEVSIALSILTAELSKPPFNNVICSFSATPHLHTINQPTLKEKIQTVKAMDWEMNTNFQAVFDLLLGLAVGCNLPPSEMVKTIFVFSDMEFDEAGGDEYETDYQLIKRKYDEAGYPMPQMVFWNLRGGNRSKPVTKDEKGVALVSGFSGQMMRTFLDNGKFDSPFQMMMKSLGNHYDHLKVVD